MSDVAHDAAVAKAMAESDLWPGAWEKMGEPERNIWLHRARAAITIISRLSLPKPTPPLTEDDKTKAWLKDRYVRGGDSAKPVTGEWRPIVDANKSEELVYWNKGGFVSSCKWRDADVDRPGDFWWDDSATEEVPEDALWLCVLPKVPT